MEIPVISLFMRNGNTFASDLDGLAEGVSYDVLISSLYKIHGNTPILAVDADGMRKKDIMPDILKKIGTRREFWFMTGICSAEDVMYAFSGNASKIVVPYHFTSDDSLRDITEISDHCIPALFADREGVITRGNRKNIITAVRALEDLNFEKILVFDSFRESADPWSYLRDHADTVIPYIPSCTEKDADVIRSIGFPDIMVSGLKSVQHTSQR